MKFGYDRFLNHSEIELHRLEAAVVYRIDANLAKAIHRECYMMKKGWFFLMFLGVSATVALAQGERPEGRSSAAVLARFFELDEAQIAVFQDLLTTRHEDVAVLRAQAQEIAASIRQAIGEPDPDPFAIGELVLAEHAIGEEIRQAEQTFTQGFVTMLTAEQMERYDALARASRLVPVIKAAAEIKLQLVPPEPQ